MTTEKHDGKSLWSRTPPIHPREMSSGTGKAHREISYYIPWLDLKPHVEVSAHVIVNAVEPAYYDRLWSAVADPGGLGFL